MTVIDELLCVATESTDIFNCLVLNNKLKVKWKSMYCSLVDLKMFLCFN